METKNKDSSVAEKGEVEVLNFRVSEQEAEKEGWM